MQDDTILLICGHSRVVDAVLNAAADDGTAFKVIHAAGAQSPPKEFLDQLRRKDIPVAEINFDALAEAARKATFSLVGAESVVENGGVISSMGTQQIGFLMKSLNKPLYVAAESHKFVRVYPLSSGDLGLGGEVLKFRCGDDEGHETLNASGAETPSVHLDFTPPNLITALVTESGVRRPNAVSEELIKIWF